MGSSTKLILVGWDGADWRIAGPLMERGLLPQLRDMTLHGASGDLRSLPPYLSPMLWNTIATGKSPAEHGIIGFTEFNPATHAVQPMSSRSRRCKALWNILSQEGRKAHVVGWFASHPAERVNGVVVAETFGKFPKGKTTGKAPRGSVFPEDMTEELEPLRLPPDEVEKSLLQFFLPRIAEIDLRRDRRPAKLLERLSELYTYHNAAVALIQDAPPDFIGIYYHFIDWICHDFMEYGPPRRPEISERDFALYSGVVDAAYRLQDVLLRDLLKHAGPGWNCLVISDHGFLSGEERPVRTPSVTAGIAAWHRNHGVFAAAGPLFAPGVRVEGANLYDITPTVLHAFGLPVGADMAGRVLNEAFREQRPVQKIDSWETRGPSLAAAQAGELTPQESADLLKQFEDLGYITLTGDSFETAEAQTRRENAWNLGVALYGDNRLKDALPHLEEAYFHNPERAHFALSLARCQIRLGLAEEAELTLRTVEDFGPDNAEAHFHLADLARLGGRFESCLEHLERGAALGLPPRQTEPLRALALLVLERFAEAEAVCRQWLEQAPGTVELILCRVLIRQDRFEEALEQTRRLLERSPRSALAWLTLGQALDGLKATSDAKDAYEKALEIRPDFPRAKRRRFLSERALLEAEGRAPPLFFGNVNFNELSATEDTSEAEKKRAAIRAASAERHQRWRAARDAARAKHGPVPVAKPAPSAPVPNPDQAPIIVVSGLPRSGTSLMMQMLSRGGVPVKTDGQRSADDHNPRGYFEWEAIKTLREHPERIDEAAGMVVKVVSIQLGHLPRGRRYQIVWMDRPVEEIAASQETMLKQENPDRPLPALAARTQALREHRDQTLETFRRAAATPGAGLNLLEIAYVDCIRDPAGTARRLADFLGAQLPAPEQMAAAIAPSLHRNRLEKGTSHGR